MKKVIFLILFSSGLFAQQSGVVWLKELADSLADKAKKSYVDQQLLFKADLDDVNGKADTADVLRKEGVTAYSPGTKYSPATKGYVDSTLTTSLVYFSGNTIAWRDGYTFYTILQDSVAFNFTNVLPGREIAVVIENPSTYGISFNNPANYSILWKDGSVPVQADSSVDVYIFNSVNGYILGEKRGSYALPYISPPDTATPPPTGTEFYVNSEFAEIYYVNPTKWQILDGTQLPTPATQIGTNTYQIKLCRGEYEPFSLLVRPKKQIIDISTQISDLYSDTDTLSSSTIDPYYIAAWWQEYWNSSSHTTNDQKIQELLVKDPALIKNQTGAYSDQIKGYDVESNSTIYKNINATAFTNKFKIEDSQLLEPLSMTTGINRQMMFDLHCPSGQAAGTYVGTILLTFNNDGPTDTLAQIPISVTVRNFDLPVSKLKYGIYNDLALSPSLYDNDWYHPSIKDSIQYETELQAFLDAGIRYPAIGGGTPYIDDALRFMNRLGFPGDRRYMFAYIAAAFRNYLGYIQNLAGLPNKTQYASYNLSYIQNAVVTIRNEALANGLDLDSTYFYGADEANSASSTGATLDDVCAVYSWAKSNYGMKWYQAIAPYGNNFSIANGSLDLPLLWLNHSESDATYPITNVHNHMYNWRKTIPATREYLFAYNFPQNGQPNAEIYRRNHGFQAWNHGLSGVFSWKQGAMNNVWYDDDGSFPDPAIFYPTYHGILKTIEYLGMREGIDDTRYLTKLENILDTLSDATAKATGQAWLADHFEAFRDSSYLNWVGDLTNEASGYANGGINADSLDFLRDTVAGYIDYLIAGDFTPAPVTGDSLTITLDSLYIKGTLTNFPITLDMANLPSGFWSTIESENEIYFKDASGTKLSRYITGFDKINQKGVAYFKAPTLSDADTTFKIFWGNGTGESNSTATFRSEYELFLGMNEDYNSVIDYTNKHAVTFGAGRTSGDKVDGKIGYAANFDNSLSDSINVGALQMGTSSMTVTFYERVSSSSNQAISIIFENGAGSTTEEGYSFTYYLTGNQMRLLVSNGATRPGELSNTTTFNDNTWRHVAMTINRSALSYFYIDGSISDIASNTWFTGEDIQSSRQTTIGAKSSGNPFYGDLDEFRVYMGVLSSDWIITEYNNLNNQGTFFKSIE